MFSKSDKPEFLDRPKAIVRPNNSMNFDKMDNSPIAPVARDLHEKPNAKGDAPRKSSQGSSLEELVNGTSHIIQVFQSKNLKLSKAKYLWQNRKIGIVFILPIYRGGQIRNLFTIIKTDIKSMFYDQV